MSRLRSPPIMAPGPTVILQVRKKNVQQKLPFISKAKRILFGKLLERDSEIYAVNLISLTIFIYFLYIISLWLGQFAQIEYDKTFFVIIS